MPVKTPCQRSCRCCHATGALGKTPLPSRLSALRNPTAFKHFFLWIARTGQHIRTSMKPPAEQNTPRTSQRRECTSPMPKPHPVPLWQPWSKIFMTTNPPARWTFDCTINRQKPNRATPWISNDRSNRHPGTPPYLSIRPRRTRRRKIA